MTVFDPQAMLSPLSSRAEALTGPGSLHPPAVLVSVTRGDRSASTATGVDDVNTGTAARADQTFEVGSQSKMMTAVAILQMVDEGLIDLDGHVTDYLPDSVTDGIPNAGTATIRQLLALRSGMPNYADGVDIATWLENHPGQQFGPDAMLDVVRGMSATNAPGAAFNYSNTPYLLLGMMIEKITGNSWATEIEDRIFDKAGMTHSSARTLAADPDRLSSYRLDNGVLEDMTGSLWAPKGESGVVSTTTDLIAFLSALLVDGSLLSNDMLDEMLTFANTGGGNAFGLGIFRQPTSGVTVYGFAGGTLGTSSVTWYDPASQTFVSMTGTLAGTNCAAAAAQLDAALRSISGWDLPDGGPVEVRSVSAADLTVSDTSDGACIASSGASLFLDTALRGVGRATMTFADGSVLVVGDATTGTTADDDANTFSIRQDFAGAINAHNHMLGLGGADNLTGGAVGDRLGGGNGADALYGAGGFDTLAGGAGADRLSGGAGNDVLFGGIGNDLLLGRAGADTLYGGAGHDTFRFLNGDASAGSPDHIADFSRADDVVDLRPITAVEGQARSSFDWIGGSAFSGHAGELRAVVQGNNVRVEGDTDGDGQADLTIVLDGLDSISADHFLL